jgi:hypothetical protein
MQSQLLSSLLARPAPLTPPFSLISLATTTASGSAMEQSSTAGEKWRTMSEAQRKVTDP